MNKKIFIICLVIAGSSCLPLIASNLFINDSNGWSSGPYEADWNFNYSGNHHGMMIHFAINNIIDKDKNNLQIPTRVRAVLTEIHTELSGQPNKLTYSNNPNPNYNEYLAILWEMQEFADSNKLDQAFNHWYCPQTGLGGGIGTIESLFDKACSYYRNSNYIEAYRNLGYAIHILQDLIQPHHSNVIANGQHENWEAFACYRWSGSASDRISGIRNNPELYFGNPLTAYYPSFYSRNFYLKDAYNLFWLSNSQHPYTGLWGIDAACKGFYSGAGQSTAWINMIENYPPDFSQTPTVYHPNWYVTADTLLPYIVCLTAGFIYYFWIATHDHIDADEDGLIDSIEVKIGTNYFKDDTDGDGLPDGLEYYNNLNPKITDKLDFDNDGLSNSYELKISRTNPLLSDTDGDGFNDGLEVNGIYYPSNPCSNANGYIYTNPLKWDSDVDGLSDSEEILIYKTNPNKIDTDSDGYSDYVEIRVYNTYPLDPSSNPFTSVSYLMLL